jgi:hypothetical protein
MGQQALQFMLETVISLNETILWMETEGWRNLLLSYAARFVILWLKSLPLFLVTQFSNFYVFPSLTRPSDGAVLRNSSGWRGNKTDCSMSVDGGP